MRYTMLLLLCLSITAYANDVKHCDDHKGCDHYNHVSSSNSSSNATAVSIPVINNKPVSTNTNTNTNAPIIAPVITSSPQQSSTNTSTATNNGNGSNNTAMNYQYPHQAPTVIAPDAYPTSPCRVAYSGGGSWLTGGIGLSGSKMDEDCNARETARSFALIGNREAAARILCNTKPAKKAKLSLSDCESLYTTPAESIHIKVDGIPDK